MLPGRVRLIVCTHTHLLRPVRAYRQCVCPCPAAVRLTKSVSTLGFPRPPPAAEVLGYRVLLEALGCGSPVPWVSATRDGVLIGLQGRAAGREELPALWSQPAKELVQPCSRDRPALGRPPLLDRTDAQTHSPVSVSWLAKGGRSAVAELDLRLCAGFESLGGKSMAWQGGGQGSVWVTQPAGHADHGSCSPRVTQPAGHIAHGSHSPRVTQPVGHAVHVTWYGSRSPQHRAFTVAELPEPPRCVRGHWETVS